MSPGYGRRILVVEDDADIREVLAESLADAGYRVHCARNGAVALECLRRFGTDEPTLVILDVRMPVMNGYSFLDSLAADPSMRRISVLVFTASAQDRGVLVTRPSVRGTLPKPCSISDILRTVATCWSQDEGGLTSAEQL
jgi:CheY-like chemotaxis protein